MSDQYDYGTPDHDPQQGPGEQYQISTAADDFAREQLATSASAELASARAIVQQRMTASGETDPSPTASETVATELTPEEDDPTEVAEADRRAAMRQDVPPDATDQRPQVETVATPVEQPVVSVDEPTTRQPEDQLRAEARDDEARADTTREDARRPDEGADALRDEDARRDAARTEAERPEPEAPERERPEVDAPRPDPQSPRPEPVRSEADTPQPEHPQPQTVQPAPEPQASEPRVAEVEPAHPPVAATAEHERDATRAEERTAQRTAEQQARQDAAEHAAEARHAESEHALAGPAAAEPESANPEPRAAEPTPAQDRDAERERADAQAAQRIAEQHAAQEARQDTADHAAETRGVVPEHDPQATAASAAERGEREAVQEDVHERHAREQAMQRQRAERERAEDARLVHEHAEASATAPPIESFEQRILDAALAPDPAPVPPAGAESRPDPQPPTAAPVAPTQDAGRLANEQEMRASLVEDQAAERRAQEEQARLADEQHAAQAQAHAAVAEAMDRDVAAKEARGARERGDVGHVTTMRNQPRADYEEGRRVSENEHVLPGAQLRAITYNPVTQESDYTASHYRNSDTVRVERDFALEKTHGAESSDNARTADLKARLTAGERVDLNADILSPSLDESRRARDASDSEVGDRALNTAALGQAGHLFGIQRLSDDDPARSTAAKVRAFGEAINGPDAQPQAPYDPEQDDWSDFDDPSPPKKS